MCMNHYLGLNVILVKNEETVLRSVVNDSSFYFRGFRARFTKDFCIGID